ncbi:MAG: glycosyltransferase [Isosphaeraceae bacterium]|nr:glycosyltransferase [Isosphaeraceae bacterium]
MMPSFQAEATSTRSTPSAVAGAGVGAAFDLVVADASWTWTERLFSPLAELGPRVLLIKACDWRNALQQKRPVRDWLCPRRRLSNALWEQTIVLPPGWMKSYPRLGMRPVSWAIRQWRRELGETRPLALAISYPHYLYLRDLIGPDALLYYNMDDYGLYWRSRRRKVRALERQVVREADLSIFCAKVRAEELSAAVPEAENRVIHLPHGAPASSISPAPQHGPATPPDDVARLPRPLLGFVGSLGDRLDWTLLEHVAQEFPHGSIVLIGRDPEPCPREAWYRGFQRAVALPNVHRIGWRSQAEIGRYNAAFDVCLIPYRVDHPFNHVACPTKVMDYMATSRPVVTTPVPECSLYSHLFQVAETPAAFVEAIRNVVSQGSDDGKAALRWETARGATWERTSAVMLRHLLERTRDRLSGDV